ncbi:acyl-CoA dehydrogenase family protein [Variovorax sp. GB1P17]|uniref:acyl-CoA dehydrogenase family protein n=1 Tax=Variovorax sp. GB1P17 TaxID=3443740 RepID=UPI003F453FD3
MSGYVDFSLSADQRMIRDAAADFLAAQSPSGAVRQAMESERGFDPALWTRMGVEMGWCALPIAEDCGGLALSWVEVALLLEQMGRRLVCSPYFATVCLAATALQQSGNPTACAAWLPRIADGTLRATLAFGETGIGWDPARVTAVARRTDSGFVLEGSFRHVPDGAQAELLLVAALLDQAPALFAVPAGTPGLRATEHRGMDLTRRTAEVVLPEVQLPPEALVAEGARATTALQRTEALAAIALAAEQLGGAQQCLDLTLAYVAERVQFGRTLASFQAVKHRCAEMMVRIESTRSAVTGAARAACETDVTTAALLLEAACAKSFASDAFFFCAQEAIQLHGGVGFTWEYDPQLYFKRAQAGTQWLGTPDLLRERAAAALLGDARNISCTP